MSDYLVQQIAEMRSEIADLKRGRTTHRAGLVTAADPTSSTFTAALPTGETLGGLSAPSQFLPQVGEWVQLRLDGATPIYQPAGIAENAITGREIAPGAVELDQLAFDIADYTGGSTIHVGPDRPVAGAVGDLWFKEVDPGPPPTYLTQRWFAGDWHPLADQSVADAILLAEAAEAAAASKSELFVQPAAPGDLSATDKAIWLDDDDGNVSYTWSGTQWVKRQLGNGAIKPQSLVASNVIATGTVTASLLEATLVLATVIIAGNAASHHARLDSTGLRVFQADANGDGLPDEAIRLGTSSGDRLGIISGNRLVTSLDNTGAVNARVFSSQEWPTINAADHTGRGGNLLSILDRRPRGYEGRWGGLYVPSPDCVPGDGVGVFEIGARLEEGRMYRIHTSPLRIESSHANNVHEVHIRATVGVGSGAAPSPTIYSPIIARAQTTVANPLGEVITVNKLMGLNGTPGTFRQWRFLLTQKMAGTGNTVIRGNSSGDAIEMWIEDVGPYTGNLQQPNWGGGTSSVAPPPPPTAPPPTRQTLTWNAAWTYSYRQDGVRRTDTNAAYQGYGDTFNGNQWSFIGFPDMTGALAGATVVGAGLFLYAEHWWNGSGGTALIGRHAYLDAPASVQAAPVRVDGMIQVPGWRRAEGRWIDLMGHDEQNWVQGGVRGIVLGMSGAGTNREYYGRFSGAGFGANRQPVLGLTIVR